MVKIQVEVLTDAAGVILAVERLEKVLSDSSLEEFLSGGVNPYIQKRASDRFRSEGDNVSGKWQPLSPSTVEIRQSQGYGGEHPINNRTGDLENFITSSGGAIEFDGAGIGLVAPGDSADNELSLKIAMAQKGGTSKWGNQVPARPVIGINDEDDTVITNMLRVRIETALLGGLL